MPETASAQQLLGAPTTSSLSQSRAETIRLLHVLRQSLSLEGLEPRDGAAEARRPPSSPEESRDGAVAAVTHAPPHPRPAFRESATARDYECSGGLGPRGFASAGEGSVARISNATVRADEGQRPAAGSVTGGLGSAPPPRCITTFMVRNIPASCTREDLLRDWPIDGSFDFLYLPMSSGGKTTRGYVFINLVSETNAASFRERWHMRRLPHFQRSRRLNVAIADIQGLEENVLRLKEKRAGCLKSRQCKPLIIRDGLILSLDDF